MERSFRHEAETKWSGFRPDAVDGGFKDSDPVLARVAGQTEGNVLIAAGNISFEPRAVPVIGSSLIGKYRLACTVPPYKHTVVVPCVLIQQTCPDESLDDLGGDPSFSQIGENAPMIRGRFRQNKCRTLHFGRVWPVRDGRVP